MNNNKLFVAGLSYSVTGEQLQTLFAQFGTVVSATVISDRMTGQSKGFGFVEMSSKEEAQKAITLNGTEFEGRTLVVNEARPQEARPNNFGGGARGGDRDHDSRGGARRPNRW